MKKFSSLLQLEKEIDQPYFWTDSTSVNTSMCFHSFVVNRLVLTHETTSVQEWNYFNFKENSTADRASRGIPSSEPTGFLFITPHSKCRASERKNLGVPTMEGCME